MSTAQHVVQLSNIIASFDGTAFVETYTDGKGNPQKRIIVTTESPDDYNFLKFSEAQLLAMLKLLRSHED